MVFFSHNNVIFLGGGGGGELYFCCLFDVFPQLFCVFCFFVLFGLPSPGSFMACFDGEDFCN
jgi:hypothetical protein